MFKQVGPDPEMMRSLIRNFLEGRIQNTATCSVPANSEWEQDDFQVVYASVGRNNEQEVESGRWN